MGIRVVTKDCAGLGDGEFGEMADLVAASVGWEAGALSKEASDWVLASQAFEGDKLRGFLLTTLERIGGTPALVIGAGAVAATKQRSQVLGSLMHESYHKALMAFPDEDVIIASRVVSPGPFEALKALDGVRPWPGERINGEERAWGRRLAKRFGAAAFDDRTMIAKGDGEQLVLDYDPPSEPDGATLFDDCDTSAGEYVIAWGWAMAEFLEAYESPAS